jgi:hypothetical protein
MDLSRIPEAVPAKQTTCAYARCRIAELALGVLEEPFGSRVLEHIDNCAYCRVEFAALVVVVGRLAELAPCQEPGIGFETRTTSRITRLASRQTRDRELGE